MICATVAAGVLALVALTASAGASGPIQGKPKILGVEGFYVPVDLGLTDWRAGAVMVSRYPKVLPGAIPERLRDLVRFRARGTLKLKKHGRRIASRRASGGLPVAIEGHSIYYAHLLLFTRKQTHRIVHALGVAPHGRSEPPPEPDQDAALDAQAEAMERLVAEEAAIDRARSRMRERLPFASQKAPPLIVNGCEIVPGTQCAYARLTHANLAGANLAGANFSAGNLASANLIRATLTGANLADTQFTFADLTGADLSNASMDTASLIKANLTDAKLSNANLTHGRLGQANATRANLADARLVGASLIQTDLSNANLSGANLTDADLVEANLAGANLSGARFCHTLMPDDSINNRGC